MHTKTFLWLDNEETVDSTRKLLRYHFVSNNTITCKM